METPEETLRSWWRQAAEGHKEVVGPELLLTHGANVCDRNDDNQTARDVAARNSHAEVTWLLSNPLLPNLRP